MALADCIKKFGTAIDEDTAMAMLERSEELQRQGMTELEAERLVLREAADDLQKDLNSLKQQVGEQPDAVAEYETGQAINERFNEQKKQAELSGAPMTMFMVADKTMADIEKAGRVDEFLAKAKNVLNQLLPGMQLQAFETAAAYRQKIAEIAKGAGSTDTDVSRLESSYGLFDPGTKSIYLNMEAIRNDNRETTPVHEVLHPMVRHAAMKDEYTLRNLAESILALKDSGIAGVDAAISHAYLKEYPASQINDELVTEFLAQVVAGNVDLSKIEKSVADKLIDLLNQLFKAMGIEYQLSNPSDLRRLSEATVAAFNEGDVKPFVDATGRIQEGEVGAMGEDRLAMDALKDVESTANAIRDQNIGAAEILLPKVFDKENKLLDENGEPVKLYHSSNSLFDTFKKTKEKDGRFGAGVYLSFTPGNYFGDYTYVANAYLKTDYGDGYIHGKVGSETAQVVIYDPKNTVIVDVLNKNGNSVFDYAKKISEAYHAAKKDGSNPELVKAVEDVIGNSVQQTNPTRFMAATPEQQLAKAQRDLAAAENRVAGSQAQQTDMFGGGVQQGLFSGMSREDVQAFLEPYRNKVRLAQEAVDKAANAAPKQEPGQMTMFMAAPANSLTQKMRGYAERMLASGKSKEQVSKAIKNATLLSDAEVSEIVDAAERVMGADTMQQQEIPGLDEMRETIIDFGREMRKAYARGKREGGNEAAQTFKEYEQMRTRIREMITDMLKTVKKMGLLKGGEITPDLMASIVRRLAKAKTSAGLLSFYDYFKQVLRDINYDAKLSKANAVASKIKKWNKSKTISKNAAMREAVREFLAITPNKVSDIDAYLSIAEKIANTVQGIKISAGVTNDASVVNESPEISLQDIKDYNKQQQDAMLEKAEDAIIDQYADYAAMGIIDPSAMTLEEMQEIINLIDGTNDGNSKLEERIAVAEKKLAEMRKAVGYNQMSLDDVTTPDMTDSEKAIIEKLRAIDVEKLGILELAKLNDAINNIVVNTDFHGAGEIAIVADAQRDADVALEDIKAAGLEGKMGDISGKAAQSFLSKDLLMQFIFRLNKLTSQMQRHIGMNGIMKGFTKAMTLQDAAIKRVDDLKKGLKVKDIDSPVNVFRRGVYADVANNYGGTEQDMQAEFERRKTWVAESAKRLLASGKLAERQEGKLVQQVYDELLANSNTLAEVEAKVLPHNMAVVNEWRAIHAERKEYTKEHAEQYNNLMWEDVNNYTSTSPKAVGESQSDAAINQFDKAFTSRGIAHTMAGSKNKKIRSAAPPNNRVLNLDFDAVQAKAYYETNYDVEVANSIAKFKAILRHPESNKIFGSQENKDAVMQNVKATYLQQKGKNPPLVITDRLAEDFERGFVRRLQAAAARLSLGSVTQIVKQYPSVAMGTLLNLGKDAHLYGRSVREHFKDEEALVRLYKQYPIGQRGGTQAGYKKDIEIAGTEKTQVGGALASASEMAGKYFDKVNEYILSPLQFADVRVARHSWLAYYMQDLKRQGIDIADIDMSKEADSPNDEAAAYAELMVSRSQNPNDPTSMAAIFKQRGIGKLLFRVIMPFSTFSTNMRGRIINDFKKVRSGDAQQALEGSRSLIATGVEQMVFNSIKVYVLNQLVAAPATAFLKGLFDMDEEEEDNYKDPLITVFGKEFQSSSNAKQVLANSMSDFFFSGMGSAVQTTGNAISNKIYGAFVDEKYKDGKVSEEPTLFYTPSKLTDALFDPSVYGMYGIAIQKAMETYQIADEAFGYTDMYFKDERKELVYSERMKTKKVPLPEEYQRAYMLIFLTNALSLAGVGDAQISQINSKLKRQVDKKVQEEFGGRKFTITDEANENVQRANQ